MDDKVTLINVIWLHYAFFQPHTELQQLRKGFRDTLQMELLICLYPDEVRSLLCACSVFNVTAAFLLDSFVTHYSENGTNKRTLEEAVMLNCQNMLLIAQVRLWFTLQFYFAVLSSILAIL